MMQDRYIIEKKDPEAFKETIIRFWKEYLPGTPEKRYEWLNGENPSGRNIWFFAFDLKTSELSGFMSVMPRQYFSTGKPVLAGIMGDFIVARNFRGAGLGVILANHVVSECISAGYDIMYILPNPHARKALSGSILTDKMTIKHLVMPVQSRQYIPSGLPGVLASIISPALDSILTTPAKFLSLNRKCVEEINVMDDRFDAFWKKIKDSSLSLIGMRSTAYLKWRYFNNPEYSFRMIAIQENSNIDGFLFFTVKNDKVEIFDIVTRESTDVYHLLDKLHSISRKEKCKAIYIRINKENPYYRMLKKCLYLDAKDDYSLLFSTSDSLTINSWPFLSNDRNI